MPRPPDAPLRIGTRRSPLALQQALWARRALANVTDRPIALVPLVTSGDRIAGALAAHGGKGLFVKELDAALLAGHIDCAVHSLKDIPGILAPGLCIAAVSVREDARDALVTVGGVSLAELPHQARVGTSSPRRIWQLRRRHPDLAIVDMRGNVASRLARVGTDLDAVVVAMAGMSRLGLPATGVHPLPVETMIPAVGQGTLAITVRATDTAVRTLMQRACHDAQNAVVTAAERALLAGIGGDCYTPLAGYARWMDDDADGSQFAVRGSTSKTQNLEPRTSNNQFLELRAFFATADGTAQVTHVLIGSADAPEALGQQMATQLLEGIRHGRKK